MINPNARRRRTAALALVAAAGAMGTDRLSAATYNWQIAGTNDTWSTAAANANWFVDAGSTLSPWADGNAAVFAGATGETITLASVVQPTSITIGTGNGGWAIGGAGSIAGPTTIVKNGTNDLSLNAPLQYTGGTTVNGGTLRVANSDAAFGSGPITFAASATFATQNAGGARTIANAISLATGTTTSLDGGYATLTLTGPISGNGGISKGSIGNVVIAGNSTFAGMTAANNSGLFQIGIGGGNGTFGQGALSVPAGGTFVISRGNAYSIANGISGGGAVSLTGRGTITYAGSGMYTGATTVSAGTLDLAGTLTSAITVAAGARLSGAGSTAGNITLSAGSFVQAGTTAVQGANVTATSVVNIVTPPVAPTGVPSTVDVIRYTGTTPGTAGFNGSAYRAGLVFDDTTNKKITLTYTAEAKTWSTATGNWDVGTTGNWTGGSDALFYAGDAATFNNPAAAATVSIVGTVLPSSIAVNNTNAYTFAAGTNGTIGGAGALTKSGTGTLTLGVLPNTYAGGTVINGGGVYLGSGGTGANTSSVLALGTGPVTVNAGGVLRFWIQNSGTFTYANDITLNGGTLQSEDGVNIVAGNVAIGSAGGTFQAHYNNKNLQISGDVAAAPGATSSNVTVSSLSETGARVIFTGNNSYAGTTTVTSGTFQLGNGTTTGGVGAGAVTVTAGATLAVNRLDAFVMTNPITLGGAAGNANFEIANNAPATDATFTGQITGSREFWKFGAGTLALTNATSSYAGTTVIAAGVLELATLGTGASASPHGTGNIVIAQGGTGTLRYTGPAASTNRLGTSLLQGTGTNATIDIADTASILTLTNPVTNNGAGKGMTKIGPGTLRIAAAATYDGATAINAGTLQLDAGGSLANSRITITGGKLEAGTTGAGGTLIYKVAADVSDLIALSGTGVLDLTNLKLVAAFTGVQTQPEYVIANQLVGSAFVAGTQFASVMGLPFGWSIDYDGTPTNPNAIVAVPEPGTAGVLGLGAIGLLARRRRARR